MLAGSIRGSFEGSSRYYAWIPISLLEAFVRMGTMWRMTASSGRSQLAKFRIFSVEFYLELRGK
jgi:hypothetical protein